MTIDTADVLVKYLLEHGLVSRRSAVDGQVVVVVDGTRYRIIDRNGPQLLSQGGGEPFAREAAVAGLVRDDPRFSSLRPLLPEVVLLDRPRELLVMRTFDGANDLVEHHRLAAHPAEWLPPLLGGWLATWHRTGTAVAEEGTIPRAVPSAFTGGGALARTSPALGQAIARAAAGWRAETIVHGNVDFEHVFVAPAPDRRIQLVDWSGAGAGDPAWDVGAVIEAYYAWALDPAIVSGIEGPVCTLSGDGLRGLLDSFWAAYTSAAGLAGAAARTLLLRAVAFAGARLVARIDTMLNAPERAAAATAGVQAAAAMLTTPGVVAGLILPRAPALPERWAAVR